MSLGRMMLAGCLSLVGCALVACGSTDADRYGEGHGNVVVVPPGSSEGDGCTLTQGYWKNHEESWPTSSLVIGGVEYSQEELLEIFRTAPSGDKSLILGHQLIAALLNVESGASDADLGGALAQAEAWMVANKDADGRLPYGVRGGGRAAGEASALGDKLAQFNQGNLGPGHCKDGPGSSSGDPGGTGGGSWGDPDGGTGGAGDPDGGAGGCGAHDGGDSGSGGDDGGGDDGGGDPSGTGGGSSVGTCVAACGDGAAAVCPTGYACIEGCCAAIVR
ncbi:hypothetical protein SOCE26_093200 [Sorangium cellulosum]|uniref:PE-PGRS family protein n=1 Tax=Sorangium cellulosum TaxID=56 RepID=A0A2L0F890_SORCE|nr:hypothetical protein [Sorangium cellulosum]AUX47796.1 hypothetical protein SOCE26_093200 [Sorangium cellulosum]